MSQWDFQRIGHTRSSLLDTRIVHSTSLGRTTTGCEWKCLASTTSHSRMLHQCGAATANDWNVIWNLFAENGNAYNQMHVLLD